MQKLSFHAIDGHGLVGQVGGHGLVGQVGGHGLVGQVGGHGLVGQVGGHGLDGQFDRSGMKVNLNHKNRPIAKEPDAGAGDRKNHLGHNFS